MSQLPFKTSPRQATHVVGNPSIGELEFPVYGSLLWHEREALRRADDGFSLFRESAMAAAPIAEAEGLSHIDAHAIVTRILGASLGTGAILEPHELEIRAKYSDVLSQLSDEVLAWNDRRQVAGVTALIASRLPGCEDWSEELTRTNITEALMSELYAFVSREETGTAQAKEPSEHELAEDLGKSSPAPGDPPQSPTGSGSTGDCDASTQEPLNSDQTALDLTPSDTSSAPSKRASGKNASGSTAMSSPSPS